MSYLVDMEELHILMAETSKGVAQLMAFSEGVKDWEYKQAVHRAAEVAWGAIAEGELAPLQEVYEVLRELAERSGGQRLWPRAYTAAVALGPAPGPPAPARPRLALVGAS